VLSKPSAEHCVRVSNVKGTLHPSNPLSGSFDAGLGTGRFRKVTLYAEFHGAGSKAGTPGVGLMWPVAGSHCADAPASSSRAVATNSLDMLGRLRC
jgi:hypothetical protein